MLTGDRDLSRISAYHRAVGGEGIDERTWSDLDLDDVVAKVDTTRCGIGQQVLYHLIRTPEFERQALEERERRLEHLRKLRAPIAKELRKLERLDLYDLHHLFHNELPRPRFAFLFPLISLLAVLSVAALFFVPEAIFAVIVMALVSFAVYFLYRRAIHPFVQPVTVLKRVLDVGERLAKIAGDAQLQRDTAALARLRVTTRWLVLEQFGADNITGVFYQYFNMFLLLDVNAFVFSLDTMRTRRDELARLFRAVGTYDALLAILDFRDSTASTIPRFTTEPKRARLEAVTHPLLEDPVANDLVVDGKGILVTGSNMSGKTTFLRTLGANAVLAQTIHTVCATSWEAPMLRVRSSIGKADSLAEGRSYYLREVDDIRALVMASETDEAHLFIVDELFRGTNTRERIAAGRAVLRHLNRGPHLTLASTHDLELLALLADEYEFHHFRESIRDGDLTFDYKLHDGPSSTRNAIAILELRKFPRSLIDEALAYAGDD